MTNDTETRPSDEAYRKAARRIHVHEGTIEIDDGAVVSQSEDGGAYIQAWVWVYDEDVTKGERRRDL